MQGHTTENKLYLQPEDKKGKEDTVMCLRMLVHCAHTLLCAPVPHAPTHTDLIAHVCRLCVYRRVCVHTFTHPVYPLALETQLAAWVCACKALGQAAIAHLCG